MAPLTFVELVTMALGLAQAELTIIIYELPSKR